MSYSPKNPNGQATMANSEPVVIASNQSAVPVSDGGSTLSIDDGGSTISVDGTITATLPANSGVDIGDVTINNASGASAVNIQDGGNTITVDGTVTADTELPAAASLADDTANPSTTSVGALNLAFDGTTWDRIRNVDAFTTASSTPQLGLLAALAPDRRFSSVSLATAANSTQAWDVNGAPTVIVHCGTTTTGTFIFEVTADGSNWQNAEVRLTGNDTWQGGINQTPTANNVYRIMTSGYRSLRVRTVTTLGSTVAFTATLGPESVIMMALKTGNAAHNFGYTPTHKDVEYTTQQTGAAVWTPASGKKFVVTDITIATGGTTSGIVTLWQGASADTTYNAGTDPAIFRGEFAPSTSTKPGLVKSFTVPFVSTTADHVLRITTSAAMTIYVQVDGYEI